MKKITSLPVPVNGQVKVEYLHQQNKVVTNSREVARVFCKNHRDVLRDIKNTIKNCPVGFNERNFALVEYRDKKGETRPTYLLTRQAFTLVAMGFTGPQAMSFKIAYIEAFDRMEAQLQAQLAAGSALAALPGCDLPEFWISSRQACRLKGQRHKHAKLSIKRLAQRLGRRAVRGHLYLFSYQGKNGRWYDEYRLSPWLCSVYLQYIRTPKSLNHVLDWAGEVIRLDLGAKKRAHQAFGIKGLNHAT